MLQAVHHPLWQCVHTAQKFAFLQYRHNCTICSVVSGSVGTVSVGLWVLYKWVCGYCISGSVGTVSVGLWVITWLYNLIITSTWVIITYWQLKLLISNNVNVILANKVTKSWWRDSTSVCSQYDCDRKVVLRTQQCPYNNPQLFLPSDTVVGIQHLHKSNVYTLFDTLYALQSYVNRTRSCKARVFHVLFIY
jgi:hypothetical protein